MSSKLEQLQARLRRERLEAASLRVALEEVERSIAELEHRQGVLEAAIAVVGGSSGGVDTLPPLGTGAVARALGLGADGAGE